MTAEIISFPVREKEQPKKTGIKIRFDIPNIKGIPVKEPKYKVDYLPLCKQFLRNDEYRQILCGILDEEIYEILNPELQKIINCYFKLK